MLTGLPREVLQTILWFMDAGTYLTSIFLCRTVHDAANSRPLLLRQLYRIPGLVFDIGHLPTEELFLLFRRRAARSLLAVSVLADSVVYSPSGRFRFRVRECCFSPGPPPLLATVHSNSPIINVYGLESQTISLHKQLQADLSEISRFEAHEILKIAFAASISPEAFCIASLNREKPFGIVESPRKHIRELWLVIFHYSYAQCSLTHSVRRITPEKHYEPVSLALARDGRICIVWRAWGTSTKVVLYEQDHSLHVDGDLALLSAFGYNAPPLMDKAFVPGGTYIFKAQFTNQDRCLNFFLPGMPIHHLYTYCCRSDSGNRSLYLNGRSLWQLGTSEFHLIGIPFYTFCDSTFDPVVKDYSCNTTWLALAQSTHLTKVNVFIVGSNAQGPPVVVCDHAISRENGIRNDWVPLAFLSGWQQGESSIGTVIGTSPGGTRIAAATWTKLLVWSIDPQLISAEFPCYFPIEDYNVTKEIGRLRPVQLPSRGVVHSMQWTDETILYAMTDHGLVKWDVGSTSRGIERACSLEPMIECLIEHASPKLADLKLLKVSRPWS